MIASAGIDLGGTKSEVQLFDQEWQLVERQRVATPKSYEKLVQAIAGQVNWARDRAQLNIPVGVAAAGLVDADGFAFTANLPAMGHPFPHDISTKVGSSVAYVNDCRALAVSEAAFGAGQGFGSVMSLILGTGVGGGLVIDGKLLTGPSHCGGEFGHIPIAAVTAREHNLPLLDCGCGRVGCYEPYISGPGLTRLAEHICGRALTSLEISETKNTSAQAAEIWAVWLDLTSDLLLTLMQTADPEIVVIGGGLSKIPDMADDLMACLSKKQMPGFAVPQIVTALGGDASGARGAAFAAVEEFGCV